MNPVCATAKASVLYSGLLAAVLAAQLAPGAWAQNLAPDSRGSRIHTNGVAADTPQAQPDATCSYALNYSGETFSALGGSGTVAITTSSGCSWTVSGLPPWINLTGLASGTGSNSVSFIVLTNTGPDQSASFTIAGQTFTVQQESASITGLSFVGSIPHLAAADGWNTTFTLVNKSAASVQARTSFFGDNGVPLGLPLTFPQQSPAIPVLGPTLDQTLAPNASWLVEASGPDTASLLQGNAQLFATGATSSGSAVDGFAIFHYNPSLQEAVVPLETRNAPFFVLAFDNTNSVITGVAVTNLGAGFASIPIVVRDDTGRIILTGDSIGLNGGGHLSFQLPQEYPATANVRGTVEFDTPDGAQISVLGIRFTPPGTLTTIPALVTSNSGGLLAHIAVGAGWQTTFVLVNTGTTSGGANLTFYDDNGNPLFLPLTSPDSSAGLPTTASSFAPSIAGGASLWLQTSGSLASSLVTGSAQLSVTGSIQGFAIFRYSPNGQEAVVPLETRNASSYLLAYDNTGGTTTGIAISVASSQFTTFPLILRDDNGIPIGYSPLTLPPNGHTRFILGDEFPGTANIRGTVEFDTPAGAQISVLGIRTPPALTFTTLPALAN